MTIFKKKAGLEKPAPKLLNINCSKYKDQIYTLPLKHICYQLVNRIKTILPGSLTRELTTH